MNNIVRINQPLVLNITNTVTINDIANILATIGASPMMSSSQAEIEELLHIVKACNGSLVVNIGTLNADQIRLIEIAVKFANEMGVRVVLDPVGSGASKLRTDTAKKLLNNFKIEVVRGNYNEIQSLLDIEIESKGVDSISGSDETLALNFAKTYKTIVLISGETDFLSDGIKTEKISGGSSYLPQISGTGCILTSVVGAYIASSDNVYDGTKQALEHVLRASEEAEKQAESIIEFKIQFFKYMERISYE